jgi:peroxiredoxin
MHILRFLRLTMILLTLVFAANASSDELKFRLDDLDGKPIALEKQTTPHLSVICFIGTECPLAKLYAGRLGKLAKQFPSVDFIAVSSNQQDSMDDLRNFRKRYKVAIPIVKDAGNAVADQFKAQRTPEVFLVDENLQILYRGRIDDQYQPGIAKADPTRKDLMIAITERLANNTVSVSATEVDGCLIGRIKNNENKSAVNFSNQISRILQNHCMECHRQGELAPMELSSFEEVVGWSDMILEVIDEGRMPPWHADPAHGHFINERRMTSAEKQIIREWVASGSPEGNPNDLPRAKDYGPEGEWRLPQQPDQIIAMSKQPFEVPAQGVVEYQYFVADPGFEEDTWVTAAEIIPGDRGVVHHSICYIRPPDGADMKTAGWLAAYVPGQKPATYNPRRARLIPAGSKFVFQQHYTPNGRVANDLTRIGLVFGDEALIDHQLFTLIEAEQDFVIAPNDANSSVPGAFKRLPQIGELIGLAPHMHFRGKSFTLNAKFNDADDALERDPTLLNVPQYDFNWQHTYELKTPIPLSEIETLEFEAIFDNSASNPSNPNPNESVMWGDQTDEEMAVAFAIVSVPRNPQARKGGLIRAPKPAPDNPKLVGQIQEFVDDYFIQHDADKDGVVSRAETPTVIRENGFRSLDLNRNGELSKEEIQKLASRHFKKKRSGN